MVIQNSKTKTLEFRSGKEILASEKKYKKAYDDAKAQHHLLEKSVMVVAEQEAELSDILQTSMDGFWEVDLRGNVRKVNATYCKMSGYSVTELLNMSIADLDVGQTQDAIAAQMQMIISEGEARFETKHRRKDGSLYDVEVSVQYRHRIGKNSRYVGFLRDVTDRVARRNLIAEAVGPEKFNQLRLVTSTGTLEKDIKKASGRG